LRKRTRRKKSQNGESNSILQELAKRLRNDDGEEQPYEALFNEEEEAVKRRKKLKTTITHSSHMCSLFQSVKT